jgi:ABC-type Na+ transport system ATPase subunit NatA
MGCRPLPGMSIATLGVAAPGFVGLTSPPGTPDDGDDDRVLAVSFTPEIGSDRVTLHDGEADRRVSTYFEGMRQNVCIAVALAKEPSAWLLDEPTSGLDPKAPNEFSAPLGRMSDSGTAILMAMHDLFRARESGTRVGIMRHGRLDETRGTGEVGHVNLERIYLDHMRD